MADKEKTALDLIKDLTNAQAELKETKEFIEVLERRINNIRGSLCKLLPDKKWVYYNGKLYGESSTNWGGHTSSLNILEATMGSINNGDEIEDWTDKLGHHENHYD